MPRPFLRPLRSDDGSTLVVAMISVAVLAMAVAVSYKTLIPKHRSVHQASSWQEAIHGAEAGVDYAMQALNGFATNGESPQQYPWTANGWTLADATYPTNGGWKLNAASRPALGGSNNVAVTDVTVDVFTRHSAPPHHPWFRIRSTARADVKGGLVSADARDAELRRLKLSAKNGSVADPHARRTVEVVAKPRVRFARAITTVQGLSLGNSSNWDVDSFDSSDSAKSNPGTAAGGVYPDGNNTKIQKNGGIASAKPGTPGSYPPIIVGNGAVVLGDVQTVPGTDNPATAAHENVSGSGGMDQTRIRDDFKEDIHAIGPPVWAATKPLPPGNTNFDPSLSETAPERYVINGNLGAFAVKAPPPSKTGYVEIRVSGNVNIGSGNSAKITIPPNVYAKLYVGGNIDFGNGLVNMDSSSSKVATRLTVYGVGNSGTFTASGNNEQAFALYAPNYDATLNGTVETYGAMVVKSFEISGGGNGGFHYDEALGRGSDVVGWTVASYFEDSRAD
jgi:hypothetical protein